MEKKTLKELFISLAVIAALGAIVTFFTGGFGKSATEQDIDNYINNFDYIPGISDENGYSSEYWNIKFTPGENFTMFTESEISENTEIYRNDAVEETTAILKDRGLTDKMIKKVLDASYFAYETGALYTDDNTAGVIQIWVEAAYGYDEMSVEEYVSDYDEVLETNLTKGTETIAGLEFVKIAGDTTDQGMKIHSVFLTTKKDGIFLSVLCQYLNDADYVYDKMLECISTYAE